MIKKNGDNNVSLFSYFSLFKADMISEFYRPSVPINFQLLDQVGTSLWIHYVSRYLNIYLINLIY